MLTIGWAVGTLTSRPWTSLLRHLRCTELVIDPCFMNSTEFLSDSQPIVRGDPFLIGQKSKFQLPSNEAIVMK